MVLMMRHGESTWNAVGRMQWQDPRPPLTERGRAQVADAAERLVGLVTFVVTSPAVRATQSAAIVGERLGLAPVEDSRLVELGQEETTEELASRLQEVVRADLPSGTLFVTHGDVLAHAARLLAGVDLPVPANAAVVRLTPGRTPTRWTLDALF